MSKPVVENFTTVDGNYVEYEYYSPDKPNPKAKIIIMCHGGFQDAITPDIALYPQFGHALAHVDYEGEGHPKTSNPIRDIVEIKDTLAAVRSKHPELKNPEAVLIGSSRGGFAATLAFVHHPELFTKLVNYMGPINMQDPKYPYDWSVWGSDPEHKGMVEDAKKYFAATPDPYTLAKEGRFDALRDRIFMQYGVDDPICPADSMYHPFKKRVKCRGILWPERSHNVHRYERAIIASLLFIVS